MVLAPSLHHSKEKPLLYLHGGPGIATVENVPRYLQSKTWKLLRENRAILFFDYRGTGFSEPALCPGMEDALSHFLKIDSSADARQAYEISLYRDCRTQLLSEGIDIASFNSTQLSDDAEAIRKALQIRRWDVYGVSFGTTVALQLLRNHGKTIRSMIMDSPFPPNAPWPDFVRPFDTCFKVLEKNISIDPIALAHFPSLRIDFANAVKRLNETPVRLKSDEGSEEYEYSGDDFAWSIWSAMLSPKSIPFVPLAIHEVGNGNDSILPTWTTAFSDPNSFGMFSAPQSNAILCYESRPKTVSDTKESLLLAYPDFSSFAIDFDGALCDTWQPQSADSDAFKPVASTVPVLILSGEYDPVCSPLFGNLTSSTLPNSTFIIIPAASHAAIHADDCLRRIADGFLKGPKLKPKISCVSNRSQMHFITDNLADALSGYK
ncbi:MAG: alpha/beta hydrolase [Bacteroidota bacterium]|nr:alpha/beta hydrolase [Bacteroidota bacterium]